MKRLQIPLKLVYEKIYVHKIAAVNLSKIYFSKNSKKTCKPNNHDLHGDWITKQNEYIPYHKHSKQNPIKGRDE